VEFRVFFWCSENVFKYNIDAGAQSYENINKKATEFVNSILLDSKFYVM
jgi:hypothetical protein